MGNGGNLDQGLMPQSHQVGMAMGSSTQAAMSTVMAVALSSGNNDPSRRSASFLSQRGNQEGQMLSAGLYRQSLIEALLIVDKGMVWTRDCWRYMVILVISVWIQNYDMELVKDEEVNVEMAEDEEVEFEVVETEGHSSLEGTSTSGGSDTSTNSSSSSGQ
ncbi:hypothetical protein NE237_022499 [Protea cynaroides]|uniref:Uncharacterized protein n=1 Tax=Protea cynaroides TaxID=273540 RepID=A0A9Q0HDB3_9MAGN|nr:hypothetical protein NE237_022499 [Protea cynaroides]